jgi:DNA-binding transcriptional LysR family regulator
MQIRQLEILLAVVRAASYSAAARELDLTQPAVSMQMKALTREIGAPLFASRGRRLEPTAAGEVLARHAERILRLVDDARAAARLDTRGASVLRVAASSTPGAALPERIAAFAKLHPHVLVHLEVRNSRTVESLLSAGLADLGVIGGPRTDRALRSELWCDDELVFIAAPDHRLSRQRSIRPADLEHETVLIREAGSATRATLEAALLGAQFALPETRVLGDSEALKHAVAAGLGIACVSPFSVQSELELGRLCALQMRGIDLRRPLSLLLGGQTESPALLSFLSFLRSRRPKRLRLRF